MAFSCLAAALALDVSGRRCPCRSPQRSNGDGAPAAAVVETVEAFGSLDIIASVPMGRSKTRAL
jgi:hypothetical protein